MPSPAADQGLARAADARAAKPKPEEDCTLDFRFGREQTPPEDFNPKDWTVIKRASCIVAARHTSGEVRKMPAHWLDG